MPALATDFTIHPKALVPKGHGPANIKPWLRPPSPLAVCPSQDGNYCHDSPLLAQHAKRPRPHDLNLVSSRVPTLSPSVDHASAISQPSVAVGCRDVDQGTGPMGYCLRANFHLLVPHSVRAISVP